MNIEERVEIAILMRYYGKTLTEKQQNIVAMYVDSNLSLGEVSEEMGISRQAVKDALDKTFESLKTAEKQMHFVERDNKIKAFLEQANIDMTTKIKLINMLEE